jgi:hypothetical protein
LVQKLVEFGHQASQLSGQQARQGPLVPLGQQAQPVPQESLFFMEWASRHLELVQTASSTLIQLLILYMVRNQ